METDIFQDLLAVRLIGDVAEFHFPAVSFFLRTFPVVPDPRLHGKGTVDFLHGSDKPLDIIDIPSSHTQRHIQHPEIPVDRHHISDGDLPLQSQNSAVQHQNNGQDIGEQLKHWNIFRPDPGTCQFRIPVGVIFFLKLLHLKVFLRESFHHPVAADIFLHKGVQRGKLTADSVKRRLDCPHLKKGGQSRKRQNTQHAHCQLDIHGKDHDQGEHKIQHTLIDRINRRSGKIPDRVHIAGLPGHQVAGPVPVKELKIFCQQLLIDRVPHLIQDPLGTGFEIVRDNKTQNASADSRPKQNRQKTRQRAIITALDHLVNDQSGDSRTDDRQRSHHRHQEKSQDNSRPVLFQE